MVPQTITELEQQANALQQNGETAGARELVRRFIESRGTSLVATEQNQAEKLLARLYESEEGEDDWLRSSQYWRGRGNLDRAIEFVKLALEKAPTSSNALQELRIIVRQDPSQRNAARALLQQVGGDERTLEPDPTIDPGRTTLAEADDAGELNAQFLQATQLYRRRHHEEAIAILDRILTKANSGSKNYDEAQILRSKAYGRLEAGEQPLDTLPYEAVSAESQSTSAMRVGLYEDAEKHITEAIDICRAKEVACPVEWLSKREWVRTLQMAQKRSSEAEKLLRENKVNEARDALQRAQEIDPALAPRYDVLVSALQVVHQVSPGRRQRLFWNSRDQIQAMEENLLCLRTAAAEFGQPTYLMEALSTLETQVEEHLDRVEEEARALLAKAKIQLQSRFFASCRETLVKIHDMIVGMPKLRHTILEVDIADLHDEIEEADAIWSDYCQARTHIAESHADGKMSGLREAETLINRVLQHPPRGIVVRQIQRDAEQMLHGILLGTYMMEGNFDEVEKRLMRMLAIAPHDISNVASLQRIQATKYLRGFAEDADATRRTARWEARGWYVASLIFASVFAGLFIYAVLFILASRPNDTLSYLTPLYTFVPGVLSAVFFKQYADANRRLDDEQKKLWQQVEAFEQRQMQHMDSVQMQIDASISRPPAENVTPE